MHGLRPAPPRSSKRYQSSHQRLVQRLWLRPGCSAPGPSVSVTTTYTITCTLPPPPLTGADEPTSGLDSTASKALVAALQAVARSNVTCAAVIHQPSWQCLQLFDFLLLLGKGGRTGDSHMLACSLAVLMCAGVCCARRTSPAA